jgi:hypothetical protein
MEMGMKECLRLIPFATLVGLVLTFLSLAMYAIVG